MPKPFNNLPGFGRGLWRCQEGIGREVPKTADYGVHPTIIHQWKRSLLEGAAGIFERGGKAAVAAEVAEETVRDLHAKIGELAVANDFLSRKLKPWIGK